MKTMLFPESYTHWLKPRLPHPISESLATCDSCTMLAPSGLTRDPGPFKQELKCCTYFPFIPNFGLGSMLKTHGATARVRLTSAAQQGILLPYGLFAAPEWEKRAKKSGSKGFGRRADLLCPFFDSTHQGCSVWTSRPGVCTTYFCKSERDEEGLEFWADVEAYLNHFEWAMASEILERLDFDPNFREVCEGVMLTEEPGGERDFLVQSAWGSWATRKEEFFALCLTEAEKISSDQLSHLLDPDGLALEESLRERCTHYISAFDSPKR